ncbi:MAG: DNA polymerase III subunit gamma/tau [Bacteroidales bacterium]|nr:DNA polymerase III subunit gamma/tau [Bacteroidales bacterium]
MEDFIVSALKYRPATFRSVVGQHALTTTLKNAVITKKLAHAYLFCGPRGVGKTTCARIFAKTINCFHPTSEGEACNDCESCVSFNDHRSYNIHELDAASNNSVDDIRTLIEQVRIPPQIGQYKVYIIDEVHMLSAQAFNAFLKTLEEPPRHAIFVLATTEKHKILPTILSRCQIYDFQRIGVNDTVEHLQYVAQQEGVNVEAEALNIIAQKSDGGMRDALSIFDQVVSFTGGNITYKSVIDNLNVLDYDYYFRLIESFLTGNVQQALLVFNEILNHGFEGHNFISGLSSHFRDLLVSKDPQTINLLEVGEAIGKKYVIQSQQCSLPFLYKALEIANECDLNYRISKNKRLIVELSLIRLCQILQPLTSLESPKPTIQPISPSVIPQAPVVNLVTPITVSTNTPLAKSESSTPIANTDVEMQIHNSFALPIVAENEPKIAKPTTRIPGISIKTSLQSKENTVTTTSMNSIVEDAPVDENSLKEAWAEYAGQIAGDRILIKKTLTNSNPKLTGDKRFEIYVDSQAQVDLVEAESTNLIVFLKRKLKNSFLQMTVKVNEVNERPKIYSKQEKFIAMASENPNLYKLKEAFGLEII